MRVENKPTMTWEEAPDTISPKELSQILGIGIISARNLFDKPDFPKIPKSDIGNIGKADKEVARLYIQGVKLKESNKTVVEYMILQELKKLNENFKSRKEVEEIEEGKITNIRSFDNNYTNVIHTNGD